MILTDFPRYPLTFGPSPVHPLERLIRELGGPSVWAKREDCNSGLAFGGNKTRKLEYLVPDALAQGATHLVSIGGVQSNHTRQVAAVAAKLGLQGAAGAGELGGLAGRGERPGRQHPAVADHGRARSSWSRPVSASGSSPAGSRRWTRSGEQGGVPYPIPAGASDHRLGGLGFANWADEVQQQERELGVFFDTIVVCTRHRLHPGRHDRRVRRPERPRRVLGIDASAKPPRPGRRWPGSPATPPS